MDVRIDFGKDLQEIFIPVLKNVFEEVFPSKFEIRNPKTIESDKNISDIGIHFELSNPQFSQKLYYFFDRKFALNLTKALIHELESLELNIDFILKIITELNSIISRKKLEENQLIIKNKKHFKSGFEYNFSKTEILKGYDSPFPDGKISMNLYKFISNKGEFFVGFLTSESMKEIKEKNNTKNIKKGISHVFQKEDKQDLNSSNSLISTVQLLELKKIVLTNLNEIKDLRGDSEFLLRKAKAVTELTKLWFELLKEE